MFVLGLPVIVTQRAWITGGIHAPVAVFYVLFIVMSGVLIGVRGGIVTAAVCVLGAISLTLGTAFHWLAVPAGAGSPLGAFVFVMLAIGVALVIHAPLNLTPRGDALGFDAMRMAVHDMRSPLQILLAHLDLLRQDIRGDAHARDVEEAIGGAMTLRRMTDSLLDVSRLEAGRMTIRPSETDLVTLARSVVESVRVLQPSRLVTIEGPAQVICRCDVELTRRVIDNLVGNAMKHTAVAGRVRVIVSSVDGHARLEVRDEGSGVPLEKRGSIFAPYGAEWSQSPAGCPSSGLGLAFCKLAVEAQRGIIRVEDAAPHGSVFIVELPF
jgi:signal transduction histidine kinase